MKQGWEIKKLGEVCTFCSGYTPKEHEFKKCATIPVPYFKVSDMNHLENHKYLTYTTLYLENGCKTYPKHTIVFPKNGAAIATNKKRLLGQDSVVDLNTGGVIANDKIVFYEYLYLFLLNLDFRLFTRRGAVPTLDIAELKKQAIPVPPLPVQEQIVSELDLLSGIIEKKREQLKELDALAQSIFYDMFGDPITNEKGWEVKKLKNITSKIGSGATPKGGNESYKTEGISLIRSLNVHNNSFVYKDLAYIDDNQAETLKNVTIEENDVLLNITGASVARCCVVPSNVLPARVNQHVAIIRAREILNNTFLCYLLTSHSYQQELISIGKCNGATREAITKGQLENLDIPIPPLPLQQQFASKIETIERQKELIKQSISETETLFNARMQEHFG